MVGTWKILAHKKLSSANATIDTGDWTSGGVNADTLKVIIYTLSANNDHYCYIRYNGDSDSNYVYRKNSEGEIPDGSPNTNVVYNDIYVNTRNSFVTMHIKNKLDKYGIRSEIDLRNEKIGYKIREHSNQAIPIILVIGKQEQENKSVAVRYLGSKNQEFLSLKEFLENIANKCMPPDLINEKS